ncbi:hypothetical protein P7C70_g5772, partial [Phenoliferia sp. Uapishka_3]
LALGSGDVVASGNLRPPNQQGRDQQTGPGQQQRGGGERIPFPMPRQNRRSYVGPPRGEDPLAGLYGEEGMSPGQLSEEIEKQDEQRRLATLEDVINTKDMPTQHNSPIYKDHRANLDASPVMTLRASGALIFGKTHTTEFATCQKGPITCNPHDPTRTPGGSSSGSGAVVADFQVPISLGTQTGGSTLRPGSYNGIYALKPTWNAISREGLKIWLYARSVADLELLAKVFRLEDDVTPSPEPFSLKGAKFGFTKTSVWPKAEEPVREAFTLAKKLLEAKGAIVEDVELPEEFTILQEKYRHILAGEGRAAFLGDYLGNKDLLDPLILDHVENHSKMSRADQVDAYDFIAALRPVIDKIAGKYACLITPSVTSEPPVTTEPMRYTGDASFQLQWSVLHPPAINVPGFEGPNSMPIGLTLVAPRYHDQALLKVAEAVGNCWNAGGGFTSKLADF